jgi:hypothetical protein
MRMTRPALALAFLAIVVATAGRGLSQSPSRTPAPDSKAHRASAGATDRLRPPFRISSLSVPLIGSHYLDDNVVGQMPLSDFIDSIVATGATDVLISPSIAQLYPKDNDFSQAYADQFNPPAAKMEAFAQALRARGIGLTVVPFVSVVNGDPSNIVLVRAAPTDPLLWMANYRREMLRWAAFAERVGATRFSLFVDMIQHLTFSPPFHLDGLAPMPEAMTQGWVDLAADIRKVFSGQLTSAASASGVIFAGGNDNLSFTSPRIWDSLDLIGSGFFPEPLTNLDTPTVEQLTAGWTQTAGPVRPIDYLKSLVSRYRKPFFFIDRAFHSFKGADKNHAQIFDETTPLILDLQLQANLFESLFRAFVPEQGGWLAGVSFDNWNRWLGCAQVRAPLLPRYFCSPWGENIQGKPAETVLREWYSGVRPTSSKLFVPVALSLSGQRGSYFSSELTLVNQGNTTATVRYRYTPFAGGGGGSSTSTDQLGPGRQFVIPDAIAHLRERGIAIPVSGNRGGTLEVTFDGVLSSTLVSATVRTTSPVPPDAPTGRAGLAYAGLLPGDFLFDPGYLCGLRQTLADRSNVAVQNAGGPSDGDVFVRIVFYAGDGSRTNAITSVDLPLAPGAFAQPAVPDLGTFNQNFYAKVERVSGTGPIYAYAVINDNGTNDGSFVLPVSSASQIGVPAGITIPVVVETGVYSTEVILTNPSATPRALHLVYAAAGLPGSSTFVDLHLAPGEQKVFPSFTAYLREQKTPEMGAASGPLSGPLFITGDLDGVIASARTWNADNAGVGRYGVFYGGVPYGQSATGSAWLFGLQQTSETRSNLALVNTGEMDGSRDSFRIEVYSGETGEIAGVLSQDVDARGFVQLGRILQIVPGSLSSGYVRVTRTAGNNPFIAYAVVNDGAAPGDRSGDGAFVSMVKE